MIINTTFAQKHNLTLQTLKHPLPVKNVDGSPNKAGPIHFTTIQTIRIETLDKQFHQERSEFYVTAVGTHDLILGTDWLKAHNPELDWTTSHLAFTWCPSFCILSSRLLTILPYRSATPAMVISRIEPISDTPENPLFTANTAPYFVLQKELSKYHNTTLVNLQAKTTHSTILANETHKNPALQRIPVQFQKYQFVFSEHASQCLPQHQPWNHAIDLKPNTTMKKCGIYRITPAETLVLKEYIDNHLQKGYIRPSKLSIDSPFFFVAKKGSRLRPVQDYHALNDVTIKNATPLPLIPELIDKLQRSRYFTKFDVWWGYNNIRIKEGDEWKAAFKCSLGLFEPLVMTFGLCNAPATFQSFMNDIFSDLIDKNHLVIYLPIIK